MGMAGGSVPARLGWPVGSTVITAAVLRVAVLGPSL